MSTPIINTPPRLQGQTRLLLEYIDQENLIPGDRLTPERELAKSLALATLATRGNTGIADTRTASGQTWHRRISR